MEAMQANMHSNFPAKVTHDFKKQVPIPTMAGVAVKVGIVLPPPILFAAPPEMVVLPETYI